MEIIFSNHEILWKESSFPLSQILLSVGILVFSTLVYLFYTVKFRLSSLGSFFSILVTAIVLWQGGGCNSDLKMTIDTFTAKAIVEDNIGKSQYNFPIENISGLIKLEYNKTEQKKTVTYHELLLVLKNETSFKLIKTTKPDELKTILGKFKKDLNLPLYFSWNEIPRIIKQKRAFYPRELCEAKFEKIESEISEDKCKLSWNNKLQSFLYPVFCVFFLALIIWIDTILINGFTKSHFLWLIGISLFALPFGYLTLQKWNAKTIVILQKDGITSYSENSVFGKQNEKTILYSEIKSYEAQIETTVDSFEISAFSPNDLLAGEENSLKSIASQHINFAVYGLPVVDKLILCDMISKLRYSEF